MKKIIVIALLTCITVDSLGQHPQFNIFAGPQVTTAKYSVFGQKQETKYKYGFQAGVGMKLAFENNLYFSPSAYYSMKGYRVNFNQRVYPPDTAAIDNNTRIHTFELAFMLQLDFSKNPNHVFLKGGPSLDLQIAGNEKFNLKNGGNVSRKMPFAFSAYGHYATSVLIQLGYETENGFLIYGQYSHGLGSINNADGGPRILHRVYGISIGKYFSRKKIVIDTRNKE